ncbi:hypothetical protein ACNHKD_15850 [Methylocystis sp. JAN1]|uniref:hypothetical protein n=1 Tax=Methylocystis sp. JAN1 TaxID=3397211 RepID=UPI003FA1F1A1
MTLVSLTLPERRLLAEIAVGIARLLRDILPQAEGMESGYVRHYYESAFENSCDVLWKLGVACAAYGPACKGLSVDDEALAQQKGWPPFFCFPPAEEIRSTLGDPSYETVVELEEILVTYLVLAGSYGAPGPQLPTIREVFYPHQSFLREIDALAAAGYARSDSGGFLWTEKIVPAMRRACDSGWNDDEEAADQTLKQECETQLALVPELTKARLAKAAKGTSFINFSILLRDEFDGLFLTKFPDESGQERKERLGDMFDVILLSTIYEHLRSG